MEEELDIKELFIAIWNKKLFIILITVIFALIGIIKYDVLGFKAKKDSLVDNKTLYTVGTSFIIGDSTKIVKTTTETLNDNGQVVNLNEISTIKKKICGSRGFRYFSKRHICIKVRKKLNDHETIICNFPRLSDGSYGTEKGTISEKYSIKYVSEAEKDLVQENFLKAYLDAQRYLETIGSKLL